jgi:hypothetical protein
MEITYPSAEPSATQAIIIPREFVEIVLKTPVVLNQYSRVPLAFLKALSTLESEVANVPLVSTPH